jgi:ribosomal protein L11 methyltransferase
MSTYIQLSFAPVTRETSDMLIALLADIGYDGFEEEENLLNAYISETNLDEGKLEEIRSFFGVNYTKRIIPQTNWNAVWESSFNPVEIDDFAAIRAEFHSINDQVLHDIIITPKMSFGTGHHATTFLMIQAMREIEFKGKSVFDFGTGTGVLSILAEKLGASRITAIDNDEWSIANARENLAKNASNKVNVALGDEVPGDVVFDIVLANINKNIILENLAAVARQLKIPGLVLLSGLLIEDEPAVTKMALELGLEVIEIKHRDNWLLIKLSR